MERLEAGTLIVPARVDSCLPRCTARAFCYCPGEAVSALCFFTAYFFLCCCKNQALVYLLCKKQCKYHSCSMFSLCSTTLTSATRLSCPLHMAAPTEPQIRPMKASTKSSSAGGREEKMHSSLLNFVCLDGLFNNTIPKYNPDSILL